MYCTGQALRYIVHVLHVLSALQSYSGLRSYLLGRAGDCCFMIVQDWNHVEVHKNNYAICSTIDHDIMNQVEKDVAEPNNEGNNLHIRLEFSFP